MNSFETDHLKALQAKYDQPHEKGSGIKYLKFRKFLPVNLDRAYILNLHRAKPMKVLDIGAGPGYFVHICNHFGHDAMALDMGGTPVYDDLIDFFQINRKIWKVEAFEKLPKLGKKFDLITAFRVVFSNNSRPDEVWGVDEWEFFLKDLTNHLLTENGRVLLVLNSQKQRAHLLCNKRFDDRLLSFFIDHGAKINYSQVYFDSMEKFQDRQISKVADLKKAHDSRT